MLISAHRVMDIHRCRFVPYTAPAINALAFSHPSTPNASGYGPKTLRLALGRANGDIEIWNPLRGQWFQEFIIRGGKDRSIEGLVWTQDSQREEEDENGKKTVKPGMLRLFSIGYSTSITEWDLSLGRPVSHSSGVHGEIWCVAAQPRLPAGAAEKESGKDGQAQAQHLVAGCADGTLVIHSTAEGELKYLRTLTRSSSKKSRVLCITFVGRERVAAGYADSTIRVFSIKNGSQLSAMSLSIGPKNGPSEVLVWTVKSLPDGTIVSGDSTGEVKFWDGKTYTLMQRILSHRADILDLAVSADGESMISGGMDRRSTVYRAIGTAKKGMPRRWAEMAHRRFHTHDVKTMAVFETKDMSVVASGGLDTNLIIIPLREFGREYYRTLPNLSQLPPLQSAPSKRLLMTWWDREINVWRVNGQNEGFEEQDGFGDPTEKARTLVAKIMIQGEECLTTVALSPGGDMIAASALSQIKVFQLQTKQSSPMNVLKVRKINVSEEIASLSARIIQFSPDSKWLLHVGADNKIRLLRIISNDGQVEFSAKAVVLDRISRHPLNSEPQHGSHEGYERSISRAAFSADSRILVTADLTGFVDTWVLEGYEDLTQAPNGLVNGHKALPLEYSGVDSDAGSDFDSDSDSDSQTSIILGQHWIQNPHAKLLPKLPSTPLVLSFRPVISSSKDVVNTGTPILPHPTRRNAHPISHDLPKGEDRLIVVTAQNSVYEYSVLSGGLSDWSRRNPPERFPAEYRQLRDRIMGVVWDIGKRKERLWVYGSSFLFMFDLYMDFPVPVEDQGGSASDGAAVVSANTTIELSKKSKKRKREASERVKVTRDISKPDTGAGSKVRENDNDTGIGSTIRKIEGPDLDDAQAIEMSSKAHKSVSDTEEEDDEEDGHGSSRSLVRLRREGETSESGAEVSNKKSKKERKPFWFTLKYRPIFGIVPIQPLESSPVSLLESEANNDEKSAKLSNGDVDSEDINTEGLSKNQIHKLKKRVKKAQMEAEERRAGLPVGPSSKGLKKKKQFPLEVVLVERPLWDMDLPKRWVGDQEWSK
ncbi:MAG: U3 small nucleolar RNA-associated protein [Icmadophila ericetorum]|nr:U3 small nucleolar RNA-associated protein [Icmadophila ericetorum]